MFKFIDTDLKEHVEVDAIDRNGTRFYPIPGADKYYPSVTSITSFKNAAFFSKWRKRIGETEANRITARATQRGTAFHSITEDYFEQEVQLKHLMQMMVLFQRIDYSIDLCFLCLKQQQQN